MKNTHGNGLIHLAPSAKILVCIYIYTVRISTGILNITTAVFYFLSYSIQANADVQSQITTGSLPSISLSSKLEPVIFVTSTPYT
jgi:hypothetical protein